MEKYRDCIVFVLEGRTDVEFYITLMTYLCRNHSVGMEPVELDDSDDAVIYTLTTDEGKSLLFVKVLYSITKIPAKITNWFNIRRNKYGHGCKWTLFLCYDSDDYSYDTTDFGNNGSDGIFSKEYWISMEKELSSRAVVREMTAVADIEDVFLEDLNGVCEYVKSKKTSEKDVCAVPISWTERKGKKKMEQLFRENHIRYRPGHDAPELVKFLDMETIMNSDILPLKEMEQIVFK
ncbi:MAG: hypothetical protein LUD29_04640 [Clostridia bacterium]|nr:hypothetical protein [Clostridia bacterium]